MTVNFNYTSDKGFEYLHLYSGKDGDSIFDALAGNFTVIWDNNPPVVNVAQVNKASKTITMTATDNDRVNARNISYWDTKVFEATLKMPGETFTLKPVTVSESDYKTKTPLSHTLVYRTGIIRLLACLPRILLETQEPKRLMHR